MRSEPNFLLSKSVQGLEDSGTGEMSIAAMAGWACVVFLLLLVVRRAVGMASRPRAASPAHETAEANQESQGWAM